MESLFRRLIEEVGDLDPSRPAQRRPSLIDQQLPVPETPMTRTGMRVTFQLTPATPLAPAVTPTVRAIPRLP